MKFGSTATVTHSAVAIPERPLVVGRVKEVTGDPWAYPEEVHPDAPHTWREMDHYGQYGTGFAMCQCGAIGVMFDKE